MYSEILKINKNFQSSVNLELDLYNESKIDEYIPTRDICDVLKRYLLAALGDTNEKATTLMGPYGKGKSFLLLVLTFILGNKKNTKTWKRLFDKIKKVDRELSEIMLRIKENNIVLMPILINSNYDNLTQAFQLALSDSLKLNQLDQLIPQSAFSLCLEIIDKWEKKDEIKTKIIDQCRIKFKSNLEELKKELNTYSQEAYKKFLEIYDCVNNGIGFNPLVNNDIIKTYRSINTEIQKNGFKGLFIIFDEFSKFLESNSIDAIRDLKLIQDLAEACSRSQKNNPMFLCCVLHKSLSFYKRDKSNDAFKTVEGRFVEIQFNRSLDENFQIIGSAIERKKEALPFIKNFLKQSNTFYEEIIELNIFHLKDIKQELFIDCFPLNPLTAYTVIQLSEIIAQNERTLFSFLSDSDDDSFNSFIHENSIGLFNVDKVFDYFSELMQKEKENSICNYWYRANSILTKIENILEKRIIKALAVILMISDEEKLPASAKIISLALCEEQQKVDSALKKLIDNHILRKNLLNNFLSFASNNSKQIDEKIELYSKTKFKNIRYSDVLKEINEKKYFIPRKYNEENKITRFFYVTFMSEKEFERIKSFSYLFDQFYCDGIVIFLLLEKMTPEQILTRLVEINDSRVLVKYPNQPIDANLYNLIMRYVCLKEIKKENANDEFIFEEIQLFLEETKEDISILLDMYFIDTDSYSYLKNMKVPFNQALSLILEELYTQKLIFNNELVNKKYVSPQYQKAIYHVIDYLFSGEQNTFSYSETSAEHSIKKLVLDNNKDNIAFRIVIEKIKETIKQSNGKKEPISLILAPFKNAPYGIRDGILPIIFAKAISEISIDEIVFYLQTKEVDLDAELLYKALNDSRYFIKYSKKSVQKDEFLNSLLSLYKVESSESFMLKVKNLAETIRRHYYALPEIIRACNEKNNILNLDSEILSYKALFMSYNLNSYDAIFEETKIIFKSDNYNIVLKKIESMLAFELDCLTNFKLSLIKKIKHLFEIEQDNMSLKMGISKWLEKRIDSSRTPIFDSKYAKLYNLIITHSTFDDENYVNDISNILLGVYIEDWNKDRTDELINEVREFINKTKEIVYLDDQSEKELTKNNELNQEFSIEGRVLKDAILGQIDEFSGSVSSVEKIAILKEIINNILKLGD